LYLHEITEERVEVIIQVEVGNLLVAVAPESSVLQSGL
jgi:hypothetical protein